MSSFTRALKYLTILLLRAREAQAVISMFSLAVPLGIQNKTNDYEQLISIKEFISLDVSSYKIAKKMSLAR